MIKLSNNIPKEYSPFISPDGLRRTLQFLRNYYDSYTKKNYGYEDINGSQYSGVAENFGSELLLEARKILMDKPSLKNIFIHNTFEFYFDITYSNLINTYDQQYILEAKLSKDALLSNKEYRIKFSNCKKCFILRSESLSDTIVRRDIFAFTTTPPVLVIHDFTDITIKDIELPLSVDDGSGKSVDYYFLMNDNMNSFIDSYKDGILLTKPITNNMSELPFVWFCVDIFRLYPDISFKNNLDSNNNNLLTIGTDGHDISKIYPLVYGSNNTPSGDIVDDSWFIKVMPVDGNSFVKSVNNVNNYYIPISKIIFMKSNSISTAPSVENIITFDQSFIHITLSKDVEWSFKSPSVGDYDYDGTTYKNTCYAYIPMTSFSNNYPEYSADTKKQLLSAFVIEFDDKYLHQYEGICENAYSGLHVDSSSDYSDNSISKKNGTIHNIGDFEGLPPYFRYMMDRTIHRSHVELYSIRDDLNNTNQKVTDKQLSGIIVDSAVPQNDVIGILANLNLIIKYDWDTGRLYKTYGESISPNNSLSEIVFVDGNTFGNSDIVRYKLMPKFVYHGNRVFSTGMMSFDPFIEMGRVYYISNDEEYYDNNETSKQRKPARTICRVCDIPTSFIQLTNITYVAPPIVIDKQYVRTEVPYTAIDQDMLYNNKASVLLRDKDNIIFDYSTDINTIFKDESINSQYHPMTRMNMTSDISKPSTSTNYKFEVLNGGSGYANGDRFTFNIGGIYFNGTVLTSDLGIAVTITIEDNNDASKINISNIQSRISDYTTTKLSGAGTGLTVKLTIDESDWNALQPIKSTDYFNGLYAFKFDRYGTLWIWTYDNGQWHEHTQFTNAEIPVNYYDESRDKGYSISDAIINNIINQTNKNNTSFWKDIIVNNSKLQTEISSSVNINDDLTSAIISEYVNLQNTYYVVEPSQEIGNNHQLETFTMYPPISGEYILPKLHKVNLRKYYNISNMVSYSIDENVKDYQPLPMVFNPKKNHIQTYEPLTTDTYLLSKERKLTFNDVFGSKFDFKASDGILPYNVYQYNEFKEPDWRSTYINNLKTKTHKELLAIISSEISTYSEPIIYEDSSYKYSDEMLIDYIIMNKYDSPIYNRNNISILRKAGESVVKYINGSYDGIGEQPTGGYDILSYIYNPKIYLNNKSNISEELFIFKIDDAISISSLAGFVIMDNSGNDISRHSLIIYNNALYIYISSEWVKINREAS